MVEETIRKENEMVVERIDIVQCAVCGAQFALDPRAQAEVVRRVHEGVGRDLRVREHAGLPDTGLIRPPVGQGLYVKKLVECPLCRRDLLAEHAAGALVHANQAGVVVVRFASVPPQAVRAALKAEKFIFSHPVWVRRLPAMRKAQVAAFLGEEDADELLARAEEETRALAERVARACAAHGLRTVLVRAVVADGIAYDVIDP